MSNKSLEFCASSLIGFGLGLLVTKRSYYRVRMEHNRLHRRNRQLEEELENWRKGCDNLNETDKLYSEFLERKEDEEA